MDRESGIHLFSRTENAGRKLVAASFGLARIPRLGILFSARIAYAWPWRIAHAEALLSWGRKGHSSSAHKKAVELGIPVVYLEDGFLRSLGHGKNATSYSFAVDRRGIYYDATQASDLEELVARPRSEAERFRARSLIHAWRKARLSKYNHARDAWAFLKEHDLRGEHGRPFILVIDQTFDDASVRYGLADESSFRKMLAAALTENPESCIVVKAHPETACGRKRGYLERAALPDDKRLIYLDADVHPAALLEHAEAIYTVTSQVGFEALMWGKPVRTFGMPFYAGWGLTNDELPPPERRRNAPLENLVYAALVDYVRYLDPETGSQCSAERLIEWMGLQRKMRARFPETIYACGFPLYKRRILRRYFQGSAVHFRSPRGSIESHAATAVWGTKDAPSDSGMTNIRVEDGFLRSVGLGAELVPPLSLVMDAKGIHYDPGSHSELEAILQESNFDTELIERSQALVEKLVASGITKYNLGIPGCEACRHAAETARAYGRRIILVPGQVESDASVRCGTAFVRTNADLLRAVRASNPKALILFKQHPDALAGLRTGYLDEGLALQFSDLVVKDTPIAKLMECVDEVHTMTSLAGFEALLRGKNVVCYGQPFYAGWGLTRDIFPIEHRIRKLSVPELAAGALILYPTYLSRTTNLYTTPERVIEELLSWRQENSTGRLRLPLRRLLSLGKY